VTPSYHKHAKCWRVQVPAAESETGKRVTEYFETKEEAEDFITEHRKTGSIQLADLSVQEKYVLGLIRQSVDYSPELLWDVWRAYKTNQGAQRKGSVTVAELCKAFYNRQIQEKRSYRTIADDRWRLNQFAKAIGILDSKQCTSVDISRYLEAKPPGSNRRSHFKTLRKLWRWAVQLGHVAVDPMANIQQADKWGINAEHLTVASYTRLLRVVAGREPPSKGLEPTIKYQFLFPYFVLGGMAGLRTCELVRSEPTDPVLNWEDILWTKDLIHVRHEVAKQTRSRDHKRYVPLEPEAAKILKPLAGKGPIISCCDNHLYIKRRELARDMKIKLPENCLRNSYATYALTFRSLGEVAKAMGDAESTVKRFYVQTLEPGIGHDWFQPKL
jgi:site-specific recombinase XerD